VVCFHNGNVVELKGVIVDNREGRACLKTNSRSEVLVIGLLAIGDVCIVLVN